MGWRWGKAYFLCNLSEIKWEGLIKMCFEIQTSTTMTPMYLAEVSGKWTFFNFTYLYVLTRKQTVVKSFNSSTLLKRKILFKKRWFWALTICFHICLHLGCLCLKTIKQNASISVKGRICMAIQGTSSIRVWWNWSNLIQMAGFMTLLWKLKPGNYF